MLLSGGRDSTCLLDLAVGLCGTRRVSALHVNYGLRAGAGLDEVHCGALCARLDVPLVIERPSGPPRSGNLQAWARDVRYAAAGRHAGDGDIAAGHTGDDQLETVLYRLISSPSRRALLGMAPRAGALIRPLLGVSRAETGAYCRERGLGFRDDPSNDSGAFVRNRIRAELIPLLEELHPGARANVLALSGILRDEARVLDDELGRVVGGRSAIALEELEELPPALARLVIQTLADAARGAPAAGVGRRAGDVLAMGADAALDLPGGIRAVTRNGILAFERTPSRPR